MATFNTRILLKNDTEANWIIHSNFVPQKGEMVIYNPDSNFSAPRIKIGDGVTTIGDLPFLANIITEEDLATSKAIQEAFNEKVNKSGDEMLGKLTVPGVLLPDDEAYVTTHSSNKGIIFKLNIGTDLRDQNCNWIFTGMTEDSLVGIAQIDEVVIDGEEVHCGGITDDGWQGKANLELGSTAVTIQNAEDNSTSIATTAFVQAAIQAALANLT